MDFITQSKHRNCKTAFFKYFLIVVQLGRAKFQLKEFQPNLLVGPVALAELFLGLGCVLTALNEPLTSLYSVCMRETQSILILLALF